MDFCVLRPRRVIPDFAKCTNCAKFRLKTKKLSVSVRTPGFSQTELIPLLVVDVNSEFFKARYVGEEKKNSLTLRPLFTPFPIDVVVDPLNTQNLSVRLNTEFDVSSTVPSAIKWRGRFSSAKKKGSTEIILEADVDGVKCCVQSGISGVLVDKITDATVSLGAAFGVNQFISGIRTKASRRGFENTLMARLTLPLLNARLRATVTEKLKLTKAECDGTLKYKNFWLSFTGEATKHVYNMETGIAINNYTLKLATDNSHFASAHVDIHVSPSFKLGLWGGCNVMRSDRPRFGISFTAID